MTNEEILHDEVQKQLCSICELRRPKGEWIEYEEDFYVYNRQMPIKRKIRECSLCHAKIWHSGKMNFCIECGADNRKESDEEY